MRGDDDDDDADISVLTKTLLCDCLLHYTSLHQLNLSTLKSLPTGTQFLGMERAYHDFLVRGLMH